MLEIAEWLADVYFCGLGEALEAILPFVVKKEHNAKTINMARLSKDKTFIKEAISTLEKRAPKQAKALEILTEIDEISTKELIFISKCNLNSIYRLKERGFISLNKKKVEDKIFTSEKMNPNNAVE